MLAYFSIYSYNINTGGDIVLKRKAFYELEKWKKNRSDKSLIVTGARQVGKTYIVREFGKTYRSFIELNFLEEPQLCQIFKGNLSVDTILMGIRLSKMNASIIDDLPPHTRDFSRE